MSDLMEYVELLGKLKSGETVVPQSIEEAFRLAFLNAMSGGSGGDIMDQLELYETLLNMELPALLYISYDGSAVVLNNEIHILGSNGNGHAHYKWDGSTWTSVSTLPYGFNNNNSAVIHRDEIHILGSTNWTDGLRSHYKWDGTNWVELSPLPVEFSNGSAVVYDDEIHIMAPQSLGKAHYKLFNEPLKLYTIKETA